MRLRRSFLAFGAAVLLLGDLAGCSINPDAPTAPSGVSTSDKPAAPEDSAGAVKGKKPTGKRATNARVSSPTD